MKSMAVECSEAKEERTRSTLVPEVREEWRLAEMEASRPASEPRWWATRRARSSWRRWRRGLAPQVIWW